MRQTFKAAQQNFDKKFRFFKRQFKNKNINELQKLVNEKNSNVWTKLRKLGDPTSSKIALEIVNDDNSISRDIKEILERWHKDISTLFSGVRESPEMAFDDSFYQEVLNKKREFEECNQKS